MEHIVSEDGIHIDPAKVSAIRALKPPSNITNVQRLQGKINYHNHFIFNLASIGRPISIFLALIKAFEWIKDCQQAFQYILEKLTKDLVLKNPTSNDLFILNPIANKVVIASVLLQNNKIGKVCHIYYARRLLSIGQKNTII